MIHDYLQLIVPTADPVVKFTACLAAAHFDDGKAWDTLPATDHNGIVTNYDVNWPTAGGGSHMFANYPAGDNFQLTCQAWIDPAIPSTDVLFSALTIQRGPNRALTIAEIDLLRLHCIVGLNGVMEDTLAEHGMTIDESTPL